jgi:tetratricopeptide (TPR) repeat protein
MFAIASRSFRFIKSMPRLVWSRPKSAIVVALLLVAVGLLIFDQYARLQWRRAVAAVADERATEAQPLLAFCLRVWPSSQDVHRQIARNARRMGDLKLAEAHLNRCLELQGGATDDVQREFLLLRVQTGEVDELAPILFELVEQNHPDFREILNTIARTYILRLRYKPAYACLSKWIEIEQDNAKPYYWRGWVLERLNNQKGATADYHQALAIDPGMVPARLRIAEMLLEDKQAPDALPHLEYLTRQVPHDPQVQARMGICLFLQGRSEEARRLMESAVQYLPNDPALLVTLANLELQDGRPAEAEKHLQTVLKADRSDTEALFVLVSALQLLGRTEESVAVLAEYNQKRAIVETINEFLKDKADSATGTAEDYATIGRLFLQINRDKLGVYWLEKALERNADCQSAHQTLADHYTKKGDPKAAAIHRQHLRPGAPVMPPVTPAPEKKESDRPASKD